MPGLSGSRAQPKKQYLPLGHPPGHEQKKLTIGFVHTTSQPMELRQDAGLFLRTAKCDFLCCLSLGKMRRLRWLFSLVEQLIERHLKGARPLLQGFD